MFTAFEEMYRAGTEQQQQMFQMMAQMFQQGQATENAKGNLAPTADQAVAASKEKAK